MTDKKENMSATAEKKEKQTAAEENSENVQNSEGKDELSSLKEENQKLKDSFLRAYAEAENTKKRCQQEIEKNSKYAISSFAKELLGVADNLQRALSSVDDETKTKCEAFIKGVELTQNELSKVFGKFGIKKLDSLNKVFDPNFERVVQEVEDKEKPAGTIIAELQSGYTLNDRILREAMVVVTKGGKQAASKEDKQ
ncbi:MAG: nucleotide exchange factor GrpE [Alphaproteobacteria bacterium]|nr:nucleotide exchange factor GrpE [Alphaproteobacteria bacterium]